MRVVELVLHRIRDDEHLSRQMTEHDSICELVKGYNRYALSHDFESKGGMYTATGETYGSDFKRYLHYLPAVEQLRLLNQYLSHFEEEKEEQKHHHHEPEHEEPKPVVQQETAEARDERRMRHWWLKFVAISGLLFIAMIVGIVISIFYHTKTVDNALIKTMMDTATEIFKLLFASTTK